MSFIELVLSTLVVCVIFFSVIYLWLRITGQVGSIFNISFHRSKRKSTPAYDTEIANSYKSSTITEEDDFELPSYNHKTYNYDEDNYDEEDSWSFNKYDEPVDNSRAAAAKAKSDIILYTSRANLCKSKGLTMMYNHNMAKVEEAKAELLASKLNKN